MLAAIQVLNRLERIGETLRHTLNVLATTAPDWLTAWVPATWFDRYSRPFAEYRLPEGKEKRYTLAAQVGTDGRELLSQLYDASAPTWLRDVPAVQILRQVWLQQLYAVDPMEPMGWRVAEDVPPAPLLISSPYDPEARYRKKRETAWVGYKVHLTERCDDRLPHLLTDVLTTPATTPDHAVIGIVQEQLATRDLLPSEHVVDAG